MTTVTITDIGSDEVTIPVSDESDIIVQTLSDGPPLGNYIADHSLSINLGADDHPQYLNISRGDARYATKSHQEDTTIHFTLDDITINADDVVGLNQPNILYQSHIGSLANPTGLIQGYSSILENTTASFTSELSLKLNNIEENAKDDQIASEVPYTNTASLLVATNVQTAIDEVEARLDTAESKLSNIDENASVNNISDIDAGFLTNEGNTTLHYHDADRARANHTGVQSLETVVNTNTINNPLDNTTLKETIDLLYSSGFTKYVGVSHVSNGQLSINSAEYYIRSTTDGSGTLYAGYIADDDTLTIPDNSTSIVYLDYNLGFPIWTSTVDPTTINLSNKIPLAIIYRSGESANIINVSKDTIDSNAKFRKRTFYTEKFIRASGAILSNNALQIECTAGKFWFGLDELNQNALSLGGTFDYYYKGANWIKLSATAINATQYNVVGTGLSLLTNKYYTNQWVYAIFGGATNKYAVVYGQAQYASLAEALEEAPPTELPDLIHSMGVLVGVVTVYEDTLSIVSTRSVFADTLNSISIPNHNDLSGLNIGDYQHLSSIDAAVVSGLSTALSTGTVTTTNLIVGTTPPATASSTGVAGTITWDTNYLYVCVATDTWVRTALTTWT